MKSRTRELVCDLMGIYFALNSFLGTLYFHRVSINVDCFHRRYATINTADQRRQYKKDFFNEYDEYKKLHKEMADISNDFSSLENDLKAVKEGSADYKRVAKSIKDKYNALKSNRDYADKRARWQELTDKLHLIKHQIKVYDAGHIKV